MNGCRTWSRVAILLLASAIVVVTSGCASKSAKESPAASTRPPAPADKKMDTATLPTAPAPSKASAPAPASAVAMDSAPGGPAAIPPPPMSGTSSSVLQQPTGPRAGMVDDNAQFDAYLTYINGYQGPTVRRIDIAGRRFVQVLDARNRPVVDATVTITPTSAGLSPAWTMTGRTYADGRLAFYPSGEGRQFHITVKFDGVLKQQTSTVGPDGTAKIVLDTAGTAGGTVRLDLLFLVDATGSMGDEIAQLKASINTIATRIDALGQPKPLTRYGMVVYRDRKDEFVTRSFDFTENVGRFAEWLNGVYAAGGGDNPESLNEALKEALLTAQWRTEEHTIRLIFLVADAPPHLDYNEGYDYATLMPEALARGIKISSIAASGLENQGEYIFRQIAQQTMGRFVFLTYANGVSGAPGDKTAHHVEEFQVENLDDLIVRLVTDEVRHQAAQQ